MLGTVMYEPSKMCKKNIISLIYACSISLHLQHKCYTSRSNGPCTLLSFMKHTVELVFGSSPEEVATSFQTSWIVYGWGMFDYA